MYSEFIISEKIVCIILYNEEGERVEEIFEAGTLPTIAVSTRSDMLDRGERDILGAHERRRLDN